MLSLNVFRMIHKEVTEEQRASIEKLLEKFEDDEDVQNVFHNMKEADDEE